MKKCCVTKWRRCCGVCRNHQKSASVSSIYPLSSHMKCRDDTIRRPRAVNTRYENRMRHNKANRFAAYAECGDAENENRQIERAKKKINSNFFSVASCTSWQEINSWQHNHVWHHTFVPMTHSWWQVAQFRQLCFYAAALPIEFARTQYTAKWNANGKQFWNKAISFCFSLTLLDEYE